MANKLVMRMDTEGGLVSRSIPISGSTEAEIEANAQTVMDWVDGFSSSKMLSATVARKVNVTANITQTTAGAGSKVSRKLFATNRYDTPTLNKATLQIPSIDPLLVEGGAATTAGKGLVTTLMQGTTNVRGHDFSALVRTNFKHVKPPKS